MPDISLKMNKIREDIKGFVNEDRIPSLFFEDTIQLKLFRILKSSYPKFHSIYSLQVRMGHDRKVILPILERWSRFKLVDFIENYKNFRCWRLNEKFTGVNNYEP